MAAYSKVFLAVEGEQECQAGKCVRVFSHGRFRFLARFTRNEHFKGSTLHKGAFDICFNVVRNSMYMKLPFSFFLLKSKEFFESFKMMLNKKSSATEVLSLDLQKSSGLERAYSHL
jgi:hypothetical protein